MKERATFHLAGELWIVEGLAPGRLGPWARRVSQPTDMADRRVRPAVTVRVTPEDAPASAPEVRRSSDAYHLRAEDFRAQVALDLSKIEVHGEEASLPVAVRAAVRLAGLLRCVRDGRGLALHASGVELGGRAYVFAGPTDAGKTTAAENASSALGANVFADDLVFLRREEGSPEWRASGLPWEAVAGDGRDAGEPVTAAALVRIEPGKAFALDRLAGARAAAAALAAPPEVLGADTGRIVLAAARLADELPVWRAKLPEGPEAVARLLAEIRVDDPHSE